MAMKPLLGVPQTSLLLDHFRTKPSISPIEAAAMFRIRSLSRRINDLEAAGHVFSREQSRDTTGQRYVRYHYLGALPSGQSLRSPGSPPPAFRKVTTSARGRRGLAMAHDFA